MSMPRERKRAIIFPGIRVTTNCEKIQCLSKQNSRNLDVQWCKIAEESWEKRWSETFIFLTVLHKLSLNYSPSVTDVKTDLRNNFLIMNYFCSHGAQWALSFLLLINCLAYHTKNLRWLQVRLLCFSVQARLIYLKFSTSEIVFLPLCHHSCYLSSQKHLPFIH